MQRVLLSQENPEQTTKEKYEQKANNEFMTTMSNAVYTQKMATWEIVLKGALTNKQKNTIYTAELLYV